MTDRRHLIKAGLALGAAGALAAQPARAAGQAKVKTLLIASHPYPDRSVLTKGLEAAARTVGNVNVRNLESIYGFDSRAIKADEERQLTREHQRIVFLFPTHWFNLKTAVERARQCRDRRARQGARTRRARARKDEQRGMARRAWCWRVCSAVHPIDEGNRRPESEC